jgi:hypothetical protein
MNTKLRADFNGLFGTVDGRTLLCLSHEDTACNETGELITLQEGVQVTAFDEDIDEGGNKDDLLANGIVISSPEWLRCNGSKWTLQIDEFGVYHESDIRDKG